MNKDERVRLSTSNSYFGKDFSESFLERGSIKNNYIFLIDSNLPGIDGIALVKKIRTHNHFAKIIMISGSSCQNHIALSLYAGADDYIVKPFNPDHLAIKLQNAKVKISTLLKNNLKRGFKLVPEAKLVIYNGRKITLARREFSILASIDSDPNRTVSKETIYSLFDHPMSKANLDFLIHSTRKKITPLGITIKSIRNVGYKLVT